MNAPTNEPLGPTEAQRKGMRNTIIAQCFGCLALLAFSNGIILVFLTSLGTSDARIVTYLAFPFLFDALLRVPSAFLADSYGKKRIGFVGSVLMALGFFVITVAGSAEASTAQTCTAVGIAVYGIGIALSASSWFALLSPIVPSHMRGRFFGRLRFSWQLCGIVFVALCAWFLPERPPIWAYQVVIGLLALALAIRLFFYAKIPEMEKSTGPSGSFRKALLETLKADRYVSFSAYVFLLSLFTAGCPAIFGLIEKRVMGLGDNAVVWLGNLLMVGAVVGYFLGGKIVDRYTTKPAFLGCHLGYGALVFLFLSRDALPVPPVMTAGASHFLFGFSYAVSSVAISTEMLALIPPENKSLSTSLCMTLMKGGSGLSGLLSAWALSLGVLSDTWTLWGQTLSSYDAILLGYGGMVVLLVVTLGLVPSVLNKSEWMPQV